MNIKSQDSVSMTFNGGEIKQILLDHIKRVAGGVVSRDMKLLEDTFEYPDVQFIWQRERNKTI